MVLYRQPVGFGFLQVRSALPRADRPLGFLSNAGTCNKQTADYVLDNITNTPLPTSLIRAFCANERPVSSPPLLGRKGTEQRSWLHSARGVAIF